MSDQKATWHATSRVRNIARGKARKSKQQGTHLNPADNEIDKRAVWYDDSIPKYSARDQAILDLPCNCEFLSRKVEAKNAWCENCRKIIPVVERLYAKKQHRANKYELTQIEKLYYHFFPAYTSNHRYCCQYHYNKNYW